MKKILCKLNLHHFTKWILEPEDPYKAWQETQLACQLIFGFVQMGSKSGRIKRDIEKEGEVSRFISDQMTMKTNQQFRKCNICGKIEWKFPNV